MWLQTLPKLLDAPCLENKNAKLISCGARHSAMLTGIILSLSDHKMDKYFAGDGTNMARYRFHAIQVLFRLSNIDLQFFSFHSQLGLGDSIDRNIPAVVPIENLQPKNVSCGWWHTLVLAESPT
ncbi:hypothetical protein B296_00015812 [Ensete ventricosum]|uniref:Uncharacterized protein n=1 Tax=Ensete ventricosum TaxID=4639 RepID=A0A426YC59_ENSVE|nr:hypothetical protein B296_00015812 [Ensete ventricosum]